MQKSNGDLSGSSKSRRPEVPDSARSPHRPVVIVAFAIAVILFAKKSSADECQPWVAANDASIQFDGQSLFWLEEPIRTDSIAIEEMANQKRPTYAVLSARLANFDADAEVDGWMAEVALLADDNQPVVTDAHATFELSLPRLSRSRNSSSQSRDWFREKNQPKMTWSMPLRFDARGVAVVRLPISPAYPSRLGWDAMRQSGLNHPRSSEPEWSSSFDRSNQWRAIRVDPLESRLVTTGYPGFAISGFGTARLSVRVSILASGVVTTSGTLESATYVPIGYPSLVDTW